MENSREKKVRRLQRALIVLFVSADIALLALNWLQDKKAAESRYIGTIPFANQNIVWEGAGYQPYGEAAR